MKITKHNLTLALIIVGIFALSYGLLGFECRTSSTDFIGGGRSYCGYSGDTRMLAAMGASIFGLGILLYKKDKTKI